MKFDRRFLASMVPEMKQHYLDYKILVEQIRLVRKAAFTLGSAFADLNGTVNSRELSLLSSVSLSIPALTPLNRPNRCLWCMK